MCAEMPVNFPTVQSFLLLYPLRCGCTIICIWTIFRSGFCIFFFVMLVQEAFVDRHTPLGPIFIKDYPHSWTDEIVFQIFYSYLSMVVVESFLFVHCYQLASGIYCPKSAPMGQFLVCRFLVWLIELICLFLLVVIHKLLIAWYLGMLLSVVLEFYAFIVVYSYCMDVYDDEKYGAEGKCMTCEQPEVSVCCS